MTRSLEESPTVARVPADEHGSSDPRRRIVARFAVAVAASAALCLLAWSLVPRTLPWPIDIVGYPTYNNYDHQTSFTAYRLTVYAFPLLAIVFYAALAWRGPLRRGAATAERRPIKLLDALPGAPAESDTTASSLSVALRLLLPVAVVLAVVGARIGAVHGVATACALLYVLAVLAAGALWSWAVQRAGSGSREAAFRYGVALANGVGGAATAILGLWYVSRHTVVMTPTAGNRQYPWLPLWLAALGLIAMLGWTLREFRRGRPARAIERTLLVTVVGSTALFLATSALIGQIPYFEGFDDAQAVTGADLLRRGYFPWRDFLFIHGLFRDALEASVGTAVFGNTVWGAWAGGTVIWIPLCWVSVYLFTAWVSRGNAWMLAAVSVAAASGYFPAPDTRFVLLPVTLALLGATLRRRSAVWCVGLVLVVFVQAILTPEASFFAIPAFACVVAADLVHRPEETRLRSAPDLWRALRRTRWCAATGVVALLMLTAVLAAYSALGGFIDYYLVMAPGHNEGSAIAFVASTQEWIFFGLGIVAVLVTMWITTARVRRRGAWESLDWVNVAAAGFVALYGEKALGRFDRVHIFQGFGVTLPLIVLVIWKALRSADLNLVIRRSPAPRTSPRRAFTIASPALVLLLLAITFFDPLWTTASTVGARHQMWAIPATSFSKIGYASPDGIDTKMLKDLDVALRAYAGDDKPVFDMTNSLGYVYYLLAREPATRFTHIDMAIPPHAQQLLIDELKRSRPPVVIFDANQMGNASWDRIPSNIRHYMVSDYVLNGWVPVMRTHETVLLVRRDLVRPGMPVPSLSEKPATTDPWFLGAPCQWGASPNFLTSTRQGTPVQVPVQPLGKRPFVDITGWAADPGTHKAASSVVVVSGQKAIGSLAPSFPRADLAGMFGPETLLSGFHFSGIVPDDKLVSVYMLADDGKLHPVGGSTQNNAASIEFPDGHVVPTAASPMGWVDEYNVSERMVGKFEVPSGVKLTNYDLATLSAGRQDIGKSGIAITDLDGPGSGNHYITAQSVAGMKPDLPVRVGSCLQWHGYDPTKPLYVLQDGGVPVTSVTLSGIRD